MIQRGCRNACWHLKHQRSKSTCVHRSRGPTTALCCLAPGAQAATPATPAATPATAAILSATLGSRFRLPAAEVQQLLQQTGYSTDELLQALTQRASTLARPPISHFHVGAVGLAGDGSVAVGVNLEFPGMPLNASVHAEQFLVANMLLSGQQELTALAVNAAPCGHCRQFYSELASADALHFMFPQGPPQGQRTWQRLRLAQLLPHRFGPQDLLDDPSTPLLLQPQGHPLAWEPASAEALDGAATAAAAAGGADGAATLRRAADAALAAAAQSYAPYSRCFAGAAVVTTCGEVYAGSYLESAAYNPGLHPLQAALVAAVIGGLASFEQVRHVVLAERRDGVVRQEPMVRALAKAVAAADAPVTILHVRAAM